MFKSLVDGYLGLARDFLAKDHPYIAAFLAVLLAVMFFCAFLLLVLYSPTSLSVAAAGGAVAKAIRGRVSA